MSLAAQLVAQAGSSGSFRGPTIDYHALAPEIILSATVVVLVLLDSIKLDRAKAYMPVVTNLGLLGALIPLLTLAYDGTERVLFDGSYVVGPLALLLKAMFIVSAYVVVLLSTNYVAEGDYWESEYYTLLVSAVLGMVVMASSRDLIGIFVALELLSIPAYMLASWRKGDVRSNEAGMKYYLMGVFASAVLLYGMSLVYGLGGSTQLDEIGRQIARAPSEGVPVITLALLFVVFGFAFKVSAVPFHVWAPDTYEGAPTPVTAFLAVASKAAGFVALINIVFFAFLPRSDVIEPLFFVLSVASMTVGNLVALRQTNVVRMLAYSGIAQAGFMLAPFVVAGSEGVAAMQAIVIYLVIYAAMNLGAFAVIVAIARKTRSAELKDLRGLVHTMPGMAWCMVLFLASLIGIPPLGGWYAKFSVFKVLIGADTGLGWATAIIMALNTAIAAYYYLNVARTMIFDDAPDGDTTPAPRTPAALTAAVGITLVVTFAFGVLPGLLTDVTSYGPLAVGR
ncbi:NADH-quinone oxidoreductase subunit N [Dermatobacter hominis]|uniref:NADH-quinone oxidoreductase subunit N n=1 Tax=Dermatobacter hominis TaxID=2884263 RepID=UPI001D1161CC|nr:NADH-quinone oxidoreductase subunit N [Dermatobacter hominis]UDY33911.1 NADH-quinone oxidoreductase subunit N [Dermatobacter hominis]